MCFTRGLLPTQTAVGSIRSVRPNLAYGIEDIVPNQVLAASRSQAQRKVGRLPKGPSGPDKPVSFRCTSACSRCAFLEDLAGNNNCLITASVGGKFQPAHAAGSPQTRAPTSDSQNSCPVSASFLSPSSLAFLHALAAPTCRDGTEVEAEVRRRRVPLRHSPFVIRHWSFVIGHSSLVIHHSSLPPPALRFSTVTP
jgi:hypothetical protein